MDNWIVFPTIGLGSILLVVYLTLCIRRKKKPNLVTMINVVLLSSGLIGGLLLMAGCVCESLMKRISELKIYIFISGIAVLYISISGLWKAIRPKEATESSCE